MSYSDAAAATELKRLSHEAVGIPAVLLFTSLEVPAQFPFQEVKVEDWLCERGRFGLKTLDPKIKVPWRAGDPKGIKGRALRTCEFRSHAWHCLAAYDLPSQQTKRAGKACVFGRPAGAAARRRGLTHRAARTIMDAQGACRSKRSGDCSAQVDPEVVAELDEVRKMKGMTPRAVSDEDSGSRVDWQTLEVFKIVLLQNLPG